MHSALQVDDIVLAICMAVYCDGKNADNRAALGAFAATRRSLYETAYPVLWSYLSTLRPLLRCLPESECFPSHVHGTIPQKVVRNLPSTA